MTLPASIAVQDLATRLGATFRGEGSKLIRSCASLPLATPDQISFLSNAKYTKHLETTRAGCVILAPDIASRITRADLTVITASDPYFAFRQAIVLLHGFRQHTPVDTNNGISPQAAVHPTAKLGCNVQIHAFASIGPHTAIGDNTVVYPHAAVMAHASIGNDCILYPNTTVYDACVLGHRCILQSGAVIGSDGYGFATHGGAHHKIPQIGNVILEDEVEIGANSVVERAALESTVIAAGTKLGNCVVIGHNCHIGPHNLLVSQVGIAGSTTTGKYVVMAGQVGVAGHLSIADLTRIAAQSGVAQDIETPNLDHGGSPAMEAKHARRVYIQFVQLPDLNKRVRELESQVKKLTPNDK